MRWLDTMNLTLSELDGALHAERCEPAARNAGITVNHTNCPSCGTSVDATMRYCPLCGFRVTGIAASLAYAVVPAASNASGMMPGQLIGGRYRLEAHIASGAMGAVWRGRDERLHNRPCAVKSVLLGGVTPNEQNERAAWFVRETETLSTLRHPSICDIRDVIDEGGTHYLVLELIEGRTLADDLVARGCPGLPVNEIFAWATELCEALTYLHTRIPPIIFRDLKPQNVMVRPDGRIALIDFGIARATIRSGATAIGTGGYAPPEQYQGLAEPRSDVYALAALLHHLLTGRDPTIYPPFTFPDVRSFVPTLSLQAETTLQSALCMRIEDRPSSALEFMDALRGAIPIQRSFPRQTTLQPVAAAAAILLPNSQSPGAHTHASTSIQPNVSEQILAMVMHDAHEFVLTTRAAYIASSPIIEVTRIEAQCGFTVRRYRHWSQIRIGAANGRVIAACSDVTVAQTMVSILEQWMLLSDSSITQARLQSISPAASIYVVGIGMRSRDILGCIQHDELRALAEAVCDGVNIRGGNATALAKARIKAQDAAILASIQSYGLRTHIQSACYADTSEQLLAVTMHGRYEIVFTTHAAYVASKMGSTIARFSRAEARSGVGLRVQRGVVQVRIGGLRGRIVAVYDDVRAAQDIMTTLERWAQ